jgi:hypothetical protein
MWTAHDEHNKPNNGGTREEFVEENANEGTCKHYRYHYKDVVEL